MKKYPEIPTYVDIFQKPGVMGSFYPSTTYRYLDRNNYSSGGAPYVYNPYYSYRYNTDDFTIIYGLKTFFSNCQFPYQVMLITDKGVFAEETTRDEFKTTLDFRLTYFRLFKKYKDLLIVVEDWERNRGRLLFIVPDKYEEWYGKYQVIPGTKIDIVTGEEIQDPSIDNPDDCCNCPLSCICCFCNDNDIPGNIGNQKPIHPYHYFRFYESEKFNDVEWTSELWQAIQEKTIYVDAPPECYLDARSIHLFQLGWWL